jgi:hypothetical protein
MRSRALVAVGAIAVVATLAAGYAFASADSSGVGKARAALLDGDRFSTGPKAGSTFADMSVWLLDDAKRCARGSRRSAQDARCRVRFSASAYASVSAFVVAGCPPAGVARARATMLSYLDAVAAFDRRGVRAATLKGPELPKLPVC